MLKTKSKAFKKRKPKIDRDIPENWLNVGQATNPKKYPNVSRWELECFRQHESGVFDEEPRRIKRKNDAACMRNYLYWRKDVETLNDLPIVEGGSVTIGVKLLWTRPHTLRSCQSDRYKRRLTLRFSETRQSVRQHERRRVLGNAYKRKWYGQACQSSVANVGRRR